MGNRTALRDQRLPGLQLLARVEGRISNERVRSVFSVQRVQASRLLQGCSRWSATPLKRQGNEWVLGEKAPSRGLTPRELEAYLSVTQPTPWFHDARVDFTEVDVEVFRAVREACTHGVGINVRYSSIASRTSVTRLLFPTAVIRTGRRLHVRAWCPLAAAYRDFVLSRMSAPELTADRLPATAGRDGDWEKEVSVLLTPHPALPEDARRMLEAEMNAAQGNRMNVRAALMQYQLMEMQVAVDPQRETPPRFQLAVGNVEEIRDHLFGQHGIE